jgi:hypothetical protein
MSEQGAELSGFEVDDDTEGHLQGSPVIEGLEDDVEGHVQPPRGDDTDHLQSIVRQ